MKIKNTEQAAKVLADFLISDRGYHGPDIRHLCQSYPIKSLIQEYNIVCSSERTVDSALADRELIAHINSHLSTHVIELVPDFSKKIQEFLTITWVKSSG